MVKFKNLKLQQVQLDVGHPMDNLIAGIIQSINKLILLKLETDEIEKTIELTGDFTWLIDIDWSTKW